MGPFAAQYGTARADAGRETCAHALNWSNSLELEHGELRNAPQARPKSPGIAMEAWG